MARLPWEPIGRFSRRCSLRGPAATVALDQRVDLLPQISEIRAATAARSRQLDCDDLADPSSGALRHDPNPIGQEDGLRDVMGDEQDRLSGFVPDVDEFVLEA